MKTVQPEKESLAADGFATLVQAAEYLGVGRSTIYMLMDSGKLPNAKIGDKARRIPWKALRAFGEQCLVDA